MTKNPIDTIIDDCTKSYAYAFMREEHGYGHMMVNIHLTGKNEYSRPDGVVGISCQIGSTYGGDQTRETYCWNYGFDARHGKGSLVELEEAVKVMRKIARKMQQMYDQFGAPKNYADYCQRVLLSAGVKTLIAEPGDGWAHGGQMQHKSLLCVGYESMRKLEQMETALVERFVRKAA